MRSASYAPQRHGRSAPKRGPRERRPPSGRRPARWRWLFTTEGQAIALLVVAVIAGGGGSQAGVANLLVQLAALAVLALSPGLPSAFVRGSSRALVLLALATLALPLLQLVPLPQSVWSALPGREPIAQTFALIGLSDHWFPFSMSPNRTLIAFLALVPPFVVMALATRLDEEWQSRLLWTIVGLGVFNVALGAVQIVTGGSVGAFYGDGQDADQLYGTFANHNATGLFLDLALLALAGLPRKAADGGILHSLPVRIAIGAMLVIGVVLTQSRSSMAILLVPFALIGFRLLQSRRKRGWAAMGRPQWLALALAVCALGGGAYLVLSSGKVEQSASRFSDLQDERPHVWEDSLTAAKHYWPAGAGIGSFDDVFQLHESLEYLTPLRAGRAHNDYLEFAIEAGLVGFVLVGAWAIWLLGAGLGRDSALQPTVRSAALAVLVAICLQALIDYPMRTEAVLCVAAAMIGLLGKSRSRQGSLAD